VVYFPLEGVGVLLLLSFFLLGTIYRKLLWNHIFSFNLPSAERERERELGEVANDSCLFRVLIFFPFLFLVPNFLEDSLLFWKISIKNLYHPTWWVVAHYGQNSLITSFLVALPPRVGLWNHVVVIWSHILSFWWLYLQEEDYGTM
jgi:hypothetical protein